MTAILQNILSLSLFQPISSLLGKAKPDIKKYQTSSSNQHDAQLIFKLDMTLVWVIFVLLVFGMVMVYSASIEIGRAHV